MTSGSQPPRIGRPPVLAPAEREALILDAMEQVIADSGVRGATMAAIAAEAGMSKRTLYTVFEDRDAMFEAWVRRTRAFVVRPLELSDAGLELEERLKKLLRRNTAAAPMEVQLQVVRALIAESEANPALVTVFTRQGPEAARSIIAEELQRGVENGELALDDVDAAARLLLDMAHAPAIDALLAPERASALSENTEKRLELAVAVFLNGARKKPVHQ